MPDAIVIEKLEQLNRFRNEKDVIEIVVRDKKKKFKAIEKIILKEVQSSEAKEIAKKAIDILNKNNDLLQKNANMLNKVAKMNELTLIMEGINLCATCVGFAIMFAKLEKMSSQINQILAEVKQGQQIQVNYEFKKILSLHSDMLDSRKKQHQYSEEQMRELVDGEYNVLCLLIDVFLKDASQDYETLIVSIFSLASMLAVSLRYFDEIYYFNNSKTISDGDIWHSSHQNWMSVFDTLVSKDFIGKIQDYCMFELDLSTTETDAYYISLCDQIQELRQEIVDNQELIRIIDSPELLDAFKKQTKQEVETEAEAAFSETSDAMNDPEISVAYNNAMKQVVFA